MKTVYQTNAAGEFVGTTLAQESPLEPGVFLMPAGCVEEPPPEIPHGKVSVWGPSGWALVTLAQEEEKPPIEQAEEHIAKFFSTPKLLQMKVWLDGTSRENTPKLNAVFQWVSTITQDAVGGKALFPNTPHTFQEVAEEVLIPPTTPV